MNEIEHYKIIVNPTSGRGAGERIILGLQDSLRRYGVDFDLVRSERPSHAIELARQAAEEEFDVVVAVGGDGTANEVINQANELTVTAERGVLPAHLDGETLSVEGTELIVKLLPRQLDVICP